MSNENANTTESKSDLIKAIGLTLSQRRKDRGLTPEKVGQSLKIRASFVKAIEDGDWQQLPGEVYARGFVMRYAYVVGLNGKELLDPYLQAANQVDINPMKTGSSPRPTSIPDFPKSAFVWVGVGIVVVVAFIKVVISDHRSARQMTAPKEVETKPAVSAPVKEVAVPKAAAQHTLQVFSPYPLWLSVKADNRSFEGFLPQGSTWSWKGDGQFAVRIGHTQQVAMAFDGRPVTLGENQKRITLPLDSAAASPTAQESTQ